MAARDPRYRPYRFALWLLYFGVILVASVVVVTSIVRNLRGPPLPPPLGDVPTRAALRVCLGDLERLTREQDDRLFRLGAEAGQVDAVARWDAWSAEWEVRMRDLAARCALDHANPASPDAAAIDEIARARNAVLELHAGYGRLVNRFASDQADLARSAWQAIEEARAAVSRPRD